VCSSDLGVRRARKVLGRFFVVSLVLGATACAGAPSSSSHWGAPSSPYSASSSHGTGHGRVNATPRVAGSSSHQKVGRPYQVSGLWYVPAREDNYNEVGVASWYGPNFHGRDTANGEVFDQNLLSAAHTTLPIPSIVRVTNLENGRSITVRLNDRGPFVDDRIIDMSRAAAVELGFHRQGTARVRVQYMGPAGAHDQALQAGATPQTTPNTTLVSAEPAYRPQAPGLYSPDPAPVRRAPQRRPEPANRSIYVQVASFHERARAIELVRRLGAGGPVFITSVDVNGSTWHRVTIGPWPMMRAANEARDAVARMGFPDARVVSRD